MELSRNGTDLLYMMYRFSIISVLKILFSHRILVFFAFCLVTFHVPSSMLGAQHHFYDLLPHCSSLQLNMILKHREPQRCPGGNRLPVKQEKTLLPAKFLAALGFAASTSPTTSAMLPHFYPVDLCSLGTFTERIFTQVSPLPKGPMNFKWHEQRRLMWPEEKPVRDSHHDTWESRPSHEILLSLPGAGA